MGIALEYLEIINDSAGIHMQTWGEQYDSVREAMVAYKDYRDLNLRYQANPKNECAAITLTARVITKEDFVVCE